MTVKADSLDNEATRIYYNAVLKVIDDQRNNLDSMQQRITWAMSTAIVGLGLIVNSAQVTGRGFLASIGLLACGVVGVSIFCVWPRGWYWVQRTDLIKERVTGGAKASILALEIADHLQSEIGPAQKSLAKIAKVYTAGLAMLFAEVALAFLFLVIC